MIIEKSPGALIIKKAALLDEIFTKCSYNIEYDIESAFNFQGFKQNLRSNRVNITLNINVHIGDPIILEIENIIKKVNDCINTNI